MDSKTVEVGYIDRDSGRFLKLSKTEIEDAISFLKE